MQNKDYPRLLDCPFCGGEALLRERYIQGVANRKHYRRECRHCKATFADWYRSIKKADEAWNRRTDLLREVTNMVPLTIEQLKQMDGEPVWVVSDRVNGHRAEWKIVVHCGPNCTEWIVTESAWSNADYGKTWLAYDHKQGGEQT